MSAASYNIIPQIENHPHLGSGKRTEGIHPSGLLAIVHDPLVVDHREDHDRVGNGHEGARGVEGAHDVQHTGHASPVKGRLGHEERVSGNED